MSKDTARAALASLTDEEADILNSDPDLLNRFRIKHGLGAPEQPKPSLDINQIKQASGYDLSPMGLLSMGFEKAQQGANRIGEFAAEELGRRQIPAPISAGIGTALSMTPDLLMMAAQPTPAANAPKRIPSLAIEAERRALGFKVPELKTEFARGQAAKAAKVALEKGVTSATGSPTVMFRKATDLAAKSGQQLGEIRESVGPQPLKPILSALDDYQAVRLKGATGGKWDSVIRKIEDAKETVKGLVPKGAEEKVSLKRIAEAKKEIADSVNWMADNVSQRDAKGLAMAIEKGATQALAEAGGDVKTYKALKPIYSAAKTMLKGLNREIATQEGNRAIGLPALVAGASGGPATALKITGWELLNRRGAGVAASELMGLANAPKNLLPIIPASTRLSPVVNNSDKEHSNKNPSRNLSNINQSANPIHNEPPVKTLKKTLTEEKAKEYLKKAKGNREKARDLAVKDGWEIPG